VGIEWLRGTGRLAGDSVLALFLYAALAVAVVLMSLAQSFNTNLLSLLFGSVITVTGDDLWLIGGMTVVTLAIVLALYQELMQVTFDPDLAQVSGVQVRRVNLVLALLTGVVVALGMRIVGVLLVGALVVIPVTASLQVSRGFRTTLAVAVAAGLASVVCGLVAAYYWQLAAGGAVVLCALALLALAALVRRSGVLGPA
jgi:zinc transport system permease protein